MSSEKFSIVQFQSALETWKRDLIPGNFPTISKVCLMNKFSRNIFFLNNNFYKIGEVHKSDNYWFET